jgi:hypothetical protein
LLRANNCTLPQLLCTVYPELNQDFFTEKSKNAHYKKSQSVLKLMLNNLFSQEGKVFNFIFCLSCNVVVVEEYRHPDIVSGGHPLELDFFYPQLKIAVEYQVTQRFKAGIECCRDSSIIGL